MNERPGSCCAGYDEEFSPRLAARELRDYRRNGPRSTTHQLVEAVRHRASGGSTLLDIGGGVGVISFELLAAGFRTSTAVDAAAPYLETARAEAERRGLGARMSFHLGDFAFIADQLPSSDVVTLDRVVCCYPDMPRLLRAAAHRTRRVLAMVVPRAVWWNRAALALFNGLRRLARRPFRAYVHPTSGMDSILRAEGLVPVERRQGLIWRLDVYERVPFTHRRDAPL